MNTFHLDFTTNASKRLKRLDSTLYGILFQSLNGSNFNFYGYQHNCCLTAKQITLKFSEYIPYDTSACIH